MLIKCHNCVNHWETKLLSQKNPSKELLILFSTSSPYMLLDTSCWGFHFNSPPERFLSRLQMTSVFRNSAASSSFTINLIYQQHFTVNHSSSWTSTHFAENHTLWPYFYFMVCFLYVSQMEKKKSFFSWFFFLHVIFPFDVLIQSHLCSWIMTPKFKSPIPYLSWAETSHPVSSTSLRIYLVSQSNWDLIKITTSSRFLCIFLYLFLVFLPHSN